MRSLILTLALISQSAACTKEAERVLNTPVISIQYVQVPAPPAAGVVALGQCWIEQEDIGLDISAANVRKITSMNATKYSYILYLGTNYGYARSPWSDYLQDLQKNYQLIACPGENNE